MVADALDYILKLPDQVKNIEGGTRISSAFDARRLLQQALKEDEQRSFFRAKVDGCLDGNAPYNQQALNNQGRGWEANFNWLGLEATVDSSRIPYYALFSGVPSYAVFKTKFQPDDPNAEIWNKKIGEKFTCLMDRWDEFKWNVQAQQFEMIYEGWGPIVFEDPADWRFNSIPARCVLVPQESRSCLSKSSSWVIVLKNYRVHELFDKIRNEKAATKRGWSVQDVQLAIMRGTKGFNGSGINIRTRPWEEWQAKYRNKELYASFTDCDIIRCAHIFVKEYSGKISQYIFTAEGVFQDQTAEKNQGEIGFLFQDKNRFDNYRQCLNIAFQNTGRNTWHSVRGTGLKSYRHEEVRNRLDNKIVNNAILASCIFLQGADAKSNQKLQLMIAGSVAQLPPGTQAVQHRFAGDIESSMAVSRYLRNDLSQMIGSFQSRTMTREDGRGEQPTAEAVRQAANKEGSLTSSQIDNYYGELDALYSETFRRVMRLRTTDEEAGRFVDECLEAGVPIQALEKMEYVRANRLSGYGSPNMRKMAIQESFQLVPMMNEQGKNNWLNEAIATYGGPDKVQAWNPPVQQPTSDEGIAVLENTSLHEGEIPLVVSGQNNVAHLDIHLSDAEERLGPLKEQVEQGAQLDPQTLQDAFVYVSALGQHCEDHLSRLQNDPTRRQQFELFQGQLRLLTSFHGKLRSAIRSAQAEQAQMQREKQQAQSLSILDQQKLQSAQITDQIKVDKWQTDKKVKLDKAQTSNNLKRFQVGQDAQLNTIKTAEEVRLNRVKTASDIANQARKSKPNGK